MWGKRGGGREPPPRKGEDAGAPPHIFLIFLSGTKSDRSCWRVGHYVPGGMARLCFPHVLFSVQPLHSWAVAEDHMERRSLLSPKGMQSMLPEDCRRGGQGTRATEASPTCAGAYRLLQGIGPDVGAEPARDAGRLASHEEFAPESKQAWVSEAASAPNWRPYCLRQEDRHCPNDDHVACFLDHHR